MRQIAIVGTAPSTRHLVPEGWEVWMMGADNYSQGIHFDAWFELHKKDKLEELGQFIYLKWLTERTEPVYVQDPALIGGESAIRYPIEEIVEEFKLEVAAGFLSSSPAFLLALAIMQKPDKIGLWGVDVDNRGMKEIDEQRPGVSAFLIEAVKRGIEIVLPDQCHLLCGDTLYGFSGPDIADKRLITRKRQLEKHIAEYTKIWADAQATVDHHKARLEEIDYQIRVRPWDGLRLRSKG